MTTTTQDASAYVFIPDNETVSPRLKLVLEAGEAALLPPIFDGWSKEELTQAKKDLHRYYHAGRRQLEGKWREHVGRCTDARAASDLGRRHRYQQQALQIACTEIEDEMELALARKGATL